HLSHLEIDLVVLRAGDRAGDRGGDVDPGDVLPDPVARRDVRGSHSFRDDHSTPVDRGYFRPVARPEDDLSRDRLTRAVEDLRGEREHGIDGDGLLVEDVASEVDANGRSA